MMTVALAILLFVVALMSWYLVSHRKRIPHIAPADVDLPDIGHATTQIAGLTNSIPLTGNCVQVYQNGELWEQMLSDMHSAEHSIHFETYVWERGQLENRLVELLCAKAQQGIKVRVLVDAIGAMRARDRNLRKMSRCGVKVQRYRHIKALDIRRFNNRMHRKLMVVDGQIAYTGGHGVADEWLGHAEDENHWRDTGVRLTGPIVHPIQSVFIGDWLATGEPIPLAADCFPTLQVKGETLAHTVASSTQSTDSSVALFYMLAIACAKREIIIQNPYFIPDGELPDLLVRKAKTGVDVHIMLPGANNDSQLVRYAGRRLYTKLLQAGVNIYEFQPTMMHQKVMVVDRQWSHIGTTNFDLRSLVLNAELGVGITSESIATELLDAFVADRERSQKIALPSWQQRPTRSKLLEWLAYQIRGQI